VIGSAAAALARQRDWLYLNTLRTAIGGNAARSLFVQISQMVAMAQPISTHREIPAVLPAHRGMPTLAVAGAGLGAALLLGALALWFYYGTAVFFEMIASGISACF
jgi:hypothetical protein